MTQIINNYTATNKNSIQYNNTFTQAKNHPVAIKTLQDEFISQKKKNGFIEKIYDKLKNFIKIGNGSKKVEKMIQKAEKGEISADEARKCIEDYRNSQVNAEQALGDALSISAAGVTFFKLRKHLKLAGTETLLNKNTFLKNEAINKTYAKIQSFLLKVGESKTKAGLFAAAAAGLVAGITKSEMLKLNRIGSDEFKCSKKDFNNLATEEDRKAYKIAKKQKRKEQRNANFRNIASGAINGLMMPLTLLGGPIVGVPMYFIGNTLNRYFVGNRNEKNKDLKGYINSLSNDSIAQVAVIGGSLVPMIKKAQFTKVFDENLSKVINKLKDATLKDSRLQGRSTYHELDDILRNSESVSKITNNNAMNIDEKILALTDENLFAVKMRQISKDSSKLTMALRENCPPSRTLDEAKNTINKTFDGNYEVKQLLGVGTVAETYLAKDKNGKEVCIKILKKGITKEKVLADKAKFIEVVKSSNKSTAEINNLIRNIDDMSEGLIKELDLSLEMNAAKNLDNFTKVANVVKPIELKDGVYVMEKANGISLASLVELNSAKIYKDMLQNKNLAMNGLLEPKGKLATLLKDVNSNEEKVKIIDDYIKQIEARTPQFGDINLGKDDFVALIEEYQHVLVEQFNKIGKDGKILHADIHPGNIFIDINALKSRKKDALTELKSHLGQRDSNKIFTLIDTGNVVKLDKEQAMRSINLTSYIKNGNVNDIADYMLDGVEGAALGGHTKEKAKELLTTDLKKLFFDNETRLDYVTNESLVETASNIMRSHGIIPVDTQMTLNKAKQASSNSLKELVESMFYFHAKDFLESKNPRLAMGSFMTKVAKDALLLENKNKQLIKAQENMNLKYLTKEQQHLLKNNPNQLKENSEDYLTYYLKQRIKKEYIPKTE